MLYQNCMQHELLTPSEERVLLQKAQSGDCEARDSLVLSNMRLCADIAAQCVRRHTHVTVDDVMADGIVGLVHAIQKFDLRREVRFSTYATWQVYSAISRSTFFNEHVRLPEHVRRDIAKLTAARARLLQETGIEPGDARLADAVGMTVDKIVALHGIQDSAAHVQSIYTPASPEDTRLLVDLISAPQAEFKDFEIAAELEWFLDKLEPVERQIVEMRHGIHPDFYDARPSWTAIAARIQGLHRGLLPGIYDESLAFLKALGTALKAGTAELKVEPPIGQTARLFR